MFQKKEGHEDRFVRKNKEGFQGGDLVVFADKQTGVNYMAYVGLGVSTLTHLLDRDGRPLVDKLPIENS